MKATITKALATAGLLAAVGAAPLMAQGHPDHGHGDEEPQSRMMMHQMMEECPMAHEGMMGAQFLLEHAEEMELSAEQVARLQGVRERQTELRTEMMEAMATVHETLTPEQREALHERMRTKMGRMMHDMHGMMHGEGHERDAGMMGPHAPDCPMMGGPTGSILTPDTRMRADAFPLCEDISLTARYLRDRPVRRWPHQDDPNRALEVSGSGGNG